MDPNRRYDIDRLNSHAALPCDQTRLVETCREYMEYSIEPGLDASLDIPDSVVGTVAERLLEQPLSQVEASAVDRPDSIAPLVSSAFRTYQLARMNRYRLLPRGEIHLHSQETLDPQQSPMSSSFVSSNRDDLHS